MQQFRIRDARLDARETGNLLAFLFTLDYCGADGPDGDARAGRRLFIEKQSVVCHQVAGIGGVVGPRLDSFRNTTRRFSWRPSCGITDRRWPRRCRPGRIERPLFRGTELRDLIAYLKSASVAADPEPLRLLPGDAERGSFGTELLRDTRDIKAVQEALGHADIGSTMGYTELANDRLAGHPNALLGRDMSGCSHAVVRHSMWLVMSHPKVSRNTVSKYLKSLNAPEKACEPGSV